MFNAIEIETHKRVEFVDITSRIRRALKESGIPGGICYIFVPHTTAGITINENADPDVAADIISTLESLIPHSRNYRHTEGNADAHIKASILGSSVTVFVENNDLKLGTWQGIYFCEFDGPRRRKVWVKADKTD